MSRVLVLAGGAPHAHDFPAIARALAELAEGLGHDVAVVDHPDAAVERLDRDADRFDSLVVAGLWWRMQGAEYEPWRDRSGYAAPPGVRLTLAAFVEGGGGLLAVHTAAICFDDWPGWGDIVGGSWRWGISSHPPYGPVRARIVAEHPVTAGLPGTIELVDEVYGDLAVADGVAVLAVAQRHQGDADQPVVWAHRYGTGRVVYDGFGHDAASIRHRHNRRLLEKGLDWVMAAD